MSKHRYFFWGLKKGMHLFGQNIATIVNTILLFMVYLIGIGLTAIFAKIKRKKFLETKISKDKNSYWSDFNLSKKPMEDYYRQF